MKKVGKVMWRAILEIVRFVVRRISYKTRFESKIDMLIQDNKDLKLEMLRLKILQLIQHNPEEKTIICKLYDTYKNQGGNSFIDDMYKKWAKKRNVKY